ncbi:MAG: S-layer homology domain-containing protein [Clostridiales bacterium]|nr:S-layer homology domain-containing protein [Clostridiales bacterium]
MKEKTKPTRLLSILLALAMVVGMLPTAALAESGSATEPSVSAYATKEQMMDETFAPDADGNAINIGKIKLAKNDQGSTLEWYILGKDDDVAGDNTVIFAANRMMYAYFRADGSSGSYNYEAGTGYGEEAGSIDVYANHYGRSDMRQTLKDVLSDRNYFTEAEQDILNPTTVTTFDQKNCVNYTTTDKLYLLDGEGTGDSSKLLAGTDNSKVIHWDYYWDYYWDSYYYRQFYLRRAESGERWQRLVWGYELVKNSAPVAGTMSVTEEAYFQNILPASNLNLSSVLFASAAQASSGTIPSGTAMTLRLDGTDKGIGTAFYYPETGAIKATKGSTSKNVSLIVQGNDGTNDWCYSKSVDTTVTVTASDIKTALGLSEDVELSKCKIWMEIKDADKMIYAVSAIGAETTDVSNVEITDIDAPVSNTTLDTTAACATTGVSTTTPTVTWTPSDANAQYGTIYTASVRLSAGEGYKFADFLDSVTVNGNPATSADQNDDGTLTVTYTFPATDKHSIEITVDTDVRDGEAATNPTINSGYKFEFCFFIEDTDKDGVFVNDTGTSLIWDDKTFVVDKTLVEAFAEQSGGRFTYESLMAALKDEFDLDELKTEFTGGYDYSVLAYIAHSDGAEFAYNNTTDRLATNAIVKINGTDKTADCLTYTDYIVIMPGTCVFTASIATTNTGSGGGSSTPTYKVESDVSEDTDGSISFSKSSAKKGDTVTITVTPDRYYKVDSVTVKDKNAKEIAVTDNGDGTFTFKMPASKVSVEPVFSWDNPFTDMAENAFYAPAVKWALINDITNGTDDGTTFSPDADCTRGEIVTFLWKSYGCPEPVGMSSFTDVSDDAYYAKAVAWAVEKGITSGTGDGKFSPDAVCTRGQIVTLIYRSEQAQGGGMQGEWMFQNPFADVSLEDYYGEAVMWAVVNSVTSGTSDTTFSPNDNCTRGQIVTFLYRFFVK